VDSDCRQTLQIHDSVLIECPKEKANEVATIVKNTMENIYPELGVPLKVDVKIGDNWAQV
jgi:DNA polymerase I